ncbi:unnamed protein product, partial [Chrysoparadoxa australica]
TKEHAQQGESRKAYLSQDQAAIRIQSQFRKRSARKEFELAKIRGKSKRAQLHREAMDAAVEAWSVAFQLVEEEDAGPPDAAAVGESEGLGKDGDGFGENGEGHVVPGKNLPLHHVRFVRLEF